MKVFYNKTKLREKKPIESEFVCHCVLSTGVRDPVNVKCSVPFSAVSKYINKE